jgi:hypothetical protein
VINKKSDALPSPNPLMACLLSAADRTVLSSEGIVALACPFQGAIDGLARKVAMKPTGLFRRNIHAEIIDDRRCASAVH